MRTNSGPLPGGPPAGPAPLSAPIVATLLLIAADLMIFSGLGFAFWVLRLGAPVWPPPLQPRLPVGVTAANTVVLFASSAVMMAAARTPAGRFPHTLAGRLGLGAALGGLFLVVQGYEWIRLIGFGLTVSSGIFGALFYMLVGAHAAHVVAALGWLTATAIKAGRGGFADGRVDAVRACALYWHFVVALWPLLYGSVYLA